MIDPVEGRRGALIMTAWLADTSAGEQAVVLLATSDRRAPRTMPRVAAALGLAGVQPAANVHLAVGTDGWITLNVPGVDHFTRPGSPEICAAALRRGRIALIVSYLPMPAGADTNAYVDEVYTSGQYADGQIPARALAPDA